MCNMIQGLVAYCRKVYHMKQIRAEHNLTMHCISFICLYLFTLHIQWKYQINIDGTVAAYRLPYLLAGSSLVFKQQSSYHEHFYGDLQPWIHYVPFKRDLSDLERQLKWAIANDEKVVINYMQRVLLVKTKYHSWIRTMIHIGCTAVHGIAVPCNKKQSITNIIIFLYSNT